MIYLTIRLFRIFAKLYIALITYSLVYAIVFMWWMVYGLALLFSLGRVHRYWRLHPRRILGARIWM